MSDQTWEPTKMSLTIEEQNKLKSSLCADPIGMLNKLATLRTRLAEVEAEAAVMREALSKAITLSKVVAENRDSDWHDQISNLKFYEPR